MTSQDVLKARAEFWMNEIWLKRNLAVFNEIHAENFVDQSPEGRLSDRKSYKKSIKELFEAFPDWQATVDDLVIDSDSDKVAIRWTATGTHEGDFYSLKPTHKQITFKGIEIILIINGKIIMRWGEWNGLEIINQMKSE